MRDMMDAHGRMNGATERMSRLSPRPQDRDLLAGRYEITSLIGRGGVTEVFAAYDHQLERVVAIKQPRLDVPGDTVTSDRLRREALALATIESPHVAAIYDVGFGDHGVFLVMQRLCGRTLADEVGRNGAITPARACRIARDALCGLSAIHASGLVHRDLKASNVLVDRDDRAVLLDLGAALQPRKRPLTASLPGTPACLAPEQLAQGPLDGRVDLFQLGLLLMCLVTGDLAARPSELATAAAPDAAGIDPSTLAIPVALRAIIQRALSPAGHRYSSTAQMREAIDHALTAGVLEPIEASAKATRRWPELPQP
jgi:eukaryotic-like serine/threonine-protein kinase